MGPDTILACFDHTKKYMTKLGIEVAIALAIVPTSWQFFLAEIGGILP